RCRRALERGTVFLDGPGRRALLLLPASDRDPGVDRPPGLARSRVPRLRALSGGAAVLGHRALQKGETTGPVPAGALGGRGARGAPRSPPKAGSRSPGPRGGAVARAAPIARGQSRVMRAPRARRRSSIRS